MQGYRLIKEKFIKELDSNAKLYEHEKTKARVLKLKNDDNNKAFCIGFKTPPKDHTGVCHILEHMVLSGSKKYRTKEPFMDLYKTSLCTFLNAMTFPDKTIYPVSSRNEKDFRNLMDVYLDAVFFPRIYEEENIFMQEGWHYELEDKNSELKVNGIVFNEMKGAMNPDRQIIQNAHEFLYKNSTYMYNSGGEPVDIIDLKREYLLNYHKEHYHPSNSYIMLYGNGDEKKELAHLDEYLSQFEYLAPKDEIISATRLTKSLEERGCHQGDETENSDSILVAYFTGKLYDSKDDIINEIITKMFIEEEGSIIRDKILSENLADKVESVSSEGENLTFEILIKNTNEKHKARILEIIDQSIDEFLSSEIDKKWVESILNQIQYRLSTFDNSPHKPIFIAITSYNSWLYDRDIFDSFEFLAAIEDIKNNIDQVKEYVRKYLTKERMVYISNAKKDYSEEREKLIRSKLDKVSEKLSEDDKIAIAEKTKQLHEYQLREDTDEDKKTIPVLKKSDLETKLEFKDLKQDKNIYWYDTNTNDVIYLSQNIFLSDNTDEYFQSLALISYILDKVDTNKYSYKELNKEINLCAFDFEVSFLARNIYNSDNAYITMSKRLSATKDKFKDAYELFKHTHNESLLDVSRIRNILNEKKYSLKNYAESSGTPVALNEANKNLGRSYEFTSLTGFRMIKFIDDILKYNDDELKSKLEEYYKNYKEVFNKKPINLIVGNAECFNLVKDVLKDEDSFIENVDMPKIKNVRKKPNRVAVTGNTDVNYCVLSNNKEITEGSYIICSNILSNDYLHKHIRAKGGAYGDGLVLSAFKEDMYFYSYRDPNLVNTFEVYENAPEFLRNLNITESAIDELIIGSYSKFNPHLTPVLDASARFSFHLSGIDSKIINEKYTDALKTNKDSFKKFADWLEDNIKDSQKAVFTNKKAYEENKDFFDEMIEL